MKKKVSVETIIIIVVIIFTCITYFNWENRPNLVNWIGGIINTFTYSSDKQAERIVSAINEKNNESFEKLFSIKALNEAENFAVYTQELIDIIDGDIISWEKINKRGGGSHSYGTSTEYIMYEITVYTSISTHLIFVYENSLDQVDPDNEGIYMIEIVVDYDEKVSFGDWKSRTRPGVHINRDTVKNTQ